MTKRQISTIKKSLEPNERGKINMDRKYVPRANNTPSKRMIAYIMGTLLGKQFITMATSIARGCKTKKRTEVHIN